jgi:hypothetical protein
MLRTLFRSKTPVLSMPPVFMQRGRADPPHASRLFSMGPTDTLDGETGNWHETNRKYAVLAPGSDRRVMKHSPVTLLVCVLALGPGIALFPAESWANTGNQGPSIAGTGSSSGIHTGNPALAHVQETDLDGVPAQQGDIAFRNPACQQDIAGDEYADTLSAGRSCINTSDTQQQFSIQLGRRIGTRSEILGEFDGIRVGYRVAEGLVLNGIAGYPVLEAADVFNPARQVFGISATTDHAANTWELNGYLAEQQENGGVVGRSMGGAIRYLQPGRSMLIYLDYDPAEKSTGTLMASGALKLPFKTTLSATLDLQNRPIPELQQKYLTQSMTVMDGWDWILPTERLALHTAGGSNDVGILAVDLSYALSKRIKLRGDVVLLDVTNDMDTATKGESSEYYYHLKITGKDLMVPGDHSKLDLRHSVTETGRSYTATFDTRYAIKRFWNLISQLRADYHSPADEGSARWVASPNVKMEYRPNKQFGFQIEAGGSVSNGADVTVNDSRTSYFVSLGYQMKF